MPGMIYIMLLHYAHHLSISLNIFSLILFGMHFACMSTICMLYAQEGQKRSSDTTELEVRVFVNHHVDVGTKSNKCYSPISPIPALIIIIDI